MTLPDAVAFALGVPARTDSNRTGTH